MTLNIPNDNSCCASPFPFNKKPQLPDFLPKPFPPGPEPLPFPLEKNENRLDRFLDKIDRNNNGHLSDKEIRQAADTNNNGSISHKEKDQMRHQLKEYLSDPDTIQTLSADTLGKAKELMEFLDDPSNVDDTLFEIPTEILPHFPHNPHFPHVPNIQFDDNNPHMLKYAATFSTRRLSL